MLQALCLLYSAEQITDFYDIKHWGFPPPVDVTGCE